MKTIKTKKCVCGKEFKQFNSLQKYCSSKCIPKKSPKLKKVNAKKISIDKVDKLWALAIKKIANNRCEYCGKTTTLNSHHIFSRSKKSTRWNINNGICLCVAHHTFSSQFSAHKTPAEFIEWIKEKRGEKWYADLRQSANDVFSGDLEYIEQMLKSYFLN